MEEVTGLYSLDISREQERVMLEPRHLYVKMDILLCQRQLHITCRTLLYPLFPTFTDIEAFHFLSQSVTVKSHDT